MFFFLDSFIFHTMLCRAAAAIAAEEYAHHQAEHIERRQSRRDEADSPQGIKGKTSFSRRRCGMNQQRTQYLVLAPETRQGRNATDSQRGYKKCPESDLEAVTQAAHPAHILLATQRMNDRASAQEEQGLEIGVR